MVYLRPIQVALVARLGREGANGHSEPLPDLAGQHVVDWLGGGVQRSPPSKPCSEYECSQKGVGGDKGVDNQTLLGRDEKRPPSGPPWCR